MERRAHAHATLAHRSLRPRLFGRAHAPLYRRLSVDLSRSKTRDGRRSVVRTNGTTLRITHPLYLHTTAPKQGLQIERPEKGRGQRGDYDDARGLYGRHCALGY